MASRRRSGLSSSWSGTDRRMRLFTVSFAHSCSEQAEKFYGPGPVCLQYDVSSLYHVQCRPAPEQVGAVDVQAQTPRLYQPQEKTGEQDQEGNQARDKRSELGRSIRAVPVPTRHPICLLQGNGEDLG